MAILKVKVADNYASSVAFSGSVSVGNVIIVAGTSSKTITACAQTAGTAAIAAGMNSITEYTTGESAFIHYYWGIVTTGGTLTMGITTAGDVGITIHEISGINTSDAYESTAQGPSPVGQNPAVGSGLTTTIADSILFNALVDEGGQVGTVTAGSNGGTWTLTGDQPTHTHAVEYLILTGTVTNNAANFLTTGTADIAGNSALQAVAFNGTAAGGVSIGPLAETLTINETLD